MYNRMHLEIWLTKMNSKYVTERQRIIQCIYMYIKLRSKTLRFLFHLLLLGQRSSRLFCFDVAAILECTSGLNEGVQTRAWFEAKQSPHCTKADALRKSDLQVASGRFVAAGPAPPVQVKTRGTNDACSSSRTR